MKATGIIRRIDDLGRITIPKEVRRDMGLKDGDALEIDYNNGVISIHKCKKSFEQCAIEWYNKAKDPHDKSDLNFHYFRTASFKVFGDYTFCIVGNSSTHPTRGGFAKRFSEDLYDEHIGRVAAYADAMGRNLNKMIGYEE